MPKAKYKIKKKCSICGQEFYALQLRATCCSLKCSRVLYKRRRREISHQQKLTQIATSVDDTRDWISVKEATALYAVCKDTIYNLIKEGSISSINLNKRLTRVRKAELEERFQHRNKILRENSSPPHKLYSLEPKDCFTIGEVTEKFGISEKTVYDTIRKYSIPIRQIGRFVYVPRLEILEFFK